mgnify:CR=1 FL=1
MGRSAAEELDRVFLDGVKRSGMNFERFENYLQEQEMAGKIDLKKIQYQRRGSGWLIIVTARVDGTDVVQFAETDSLPKSAGKILSMLQQPVWKADKFAVSAPHAAAAGTSVLLTK